MRTTTTTDSSGSWRPSLRRSGTTRRLAGLLKRRSLSSQSPVSQTDHELLEELARQSIVFFARHFLGFDPEPAQEKVLRAAACHKRLVLNCNRQWGKSSISAILATHRLVMRPGSTVLVVAPVGRQSGETLRKVQGFLGVLGLRTRGDGVNPTSLQLENGSRVGESAGGGGHSAGVLGGVDVDH